MKDWNLLEQYKFSLKMLTIFMPICSIAVIIFGIIDIIKLPMFFWHGLLISGIGLLTFGLYFFIRKYLKKKINDLTDKKNGGQ